MTKITPVYTGVIFFGAGSGNRTRLSTLEGSHNSHYTMPACALRASAGTARLHHLVSMAVPYEARRAKYGRAGGTRTHDPLLPKQVR